MNGTSWTMLLFIGLAGLLVGAFVVAPVLEDGGKSVSEDSAWRYETIYVTGSTTVLPIVSECAKKFMLTYDEPIVSVSGGGSGTGIAALIDGTADIAAASRLPKSTEYASAASAGVELIRHEIAYDGLVVIVNPKVTQGLSSPLNLTLEQIANIFARQKTTWNQVDPSLPNHNIFLYNREPGSGTRGSFEEIVMEPFGLQISDDASIVSSNPQMRQNVADTDYAIGYVGLAFIDETIDAVWVSDDGVTYYEPTNENVADGVYPISRSLYLVTNGIPESGSLIDRFIDFVKNPKGQQIVEEVGFIAIYPTE
ncbi:MAG: PstS family phosphate ABC transporter substrate-binding protein [Candidatus Wukongarchaeota archaeon]|nr:PstS family phosphate ABC transporter substrate-binding protein [Candidatus Wukongarchaeota archaeon]